MMFRVLQKNFRLCQFSKFYIRQYAAKPEKKGAVIGVYDNCDLTKYAEKLDNESGGKIKEAAVKLNLKLGKKEVFHCLIPDYHAVLLVGLGPKEPSYNENENLNECKENVRIAAAKGCRKLQKLLIDRIEVDAMGSADAAAEGSILSVWVFQDLKNKQDRAHVSRVYPIDENDRDLWNKGATKAKAQNFSRMLEQCPSNIMTPTHFVQCVIDELCPLGIQVEARDFDWMQTAKMFAFLTMAQGSCEPPLFLELAYCGGKPDDKPVMMIGKGVTFDSGGLCLNPSCRQMIEYSADMAGAAVIAGVFKALASLKVKLNCNAIIPLCENMPGGNAAMPGLVVTALNGKTVRIDDTRHDGRVFLMDALVYADRYKPDILINIATLDEGLRMAMASGASAVFTKSKSLYSELAKAGAETGDRVWKLPLWNHYKTKISDTLQADYISVGRGRGGDPCTAAAFLERFAPKVPFIHIDITGTGRLSSGVNFPYLRKNLMTGRPVRTLIEFLSNIAPSTKS